MTPKKILLFGTMGTIGSVVGDSLVRDGFEVVRHEFPQNIFRDEAGYHRELHRAIASFTPDIILPIGEALALATFREKGNEILSPIPDSKTIRLLSGKVSFSRLADELDIPQPRILSLEEAAELQGDVIFKRDISFGGHGVHRPRNQESLLNLIEHQKPGEPFLIEEYMEGRDASVDIARFDGYFRAEAYVSLSSQGHGPSTERQPVDAPELCLAAKKIADATDYHGVCGFDFKLKDDGSFYILEANPRFTGGIATQIERGFNIPSILIEHL